MKKRFITLVLALLMVMTVSSTVLATRTSPLFAQNRQFYEAEKTPTLTFAAGSAMALPGGTASVPITISSNGGVEVHVIRFHIYYDPSFLTVESLTFGDLYYNKPSDAFVVADSSSVAGDIALGLVCSTNGLIVEEGTFVTVNFRVAEDCCDDQDITISVHECTYSPIGGTPTNINTRTETGHVEIIICPENYDANDFYKLVGFLETTDAEGIKNGDKLSETYDPTTPQTWGTYIEYYDDEEEEFARFEWNEDGRIIRISISYGDLVGALDVSNCTELQFLNCRCNNLNELDVTQCTALQEIDCDFNDLVELDITQCCNLLDLNCGSNDLIELDVTHCPELQALWCSCNNLSALDVTQCPDIRFLECPGNSLTELDVTYCTNLRLLYCDYNNLTEIDVTQCSNLSALYCSCNSLTELDVTQCTALDSLDCSYNSLTELDVTHCPLVYLCCSNNSLTELDVTQCTALDSLDCSYNCLTMLDLSNNQFEIAGVVASGAGYIGYKRVWIWNEEIGDISREEYVAAYCIDESEFNGWYNGEELVSADSEFSVTDIADKVVLTARFGSFLIGDANGDGQMNANDALAVMRYALGLIPSVDFVASDVDGNGVVNANDALMIMRAALGLITL